MAPVETSEESRGERRSAGRFRIRRRLANRTYRSWLASLVCAWLVCASFASAGFVIDVSAARGDSGGEVTWPAFPPKKPSGWNLKVNSAWVDGAGYRPIRIELSTSGLIPTTRHHTVTIMLTTKHVYHVGDRTVMQELEVEEGTSGAKSVMLMSETHDLARYEIECFEDGERIDDISGQFTTTTSGQRTEATPNIMIVSAGLVEPNPKSDEPPPAKGTFPWLPNLTECLRTFDALGPGNHNVPYWHPDTSNDAVNRLQLKTFIASSPRHMMRLPDDLPDDWLALTSVDLMFTTRADLEWLAENRPRKLAALRAWVAAGATLCVCDAGEDFENIGSIDRSLEFATSRGRPSLDTSSDWRLPDPQLYEVRPHPFTNDNGNYRTFIRTANGIETVISPQFGGPAEKSPESQQKPERRKPEDPEWFALRPLGLGRVVAFREANPFPAAELDWHWLIQSIGTENLCWFQRHGMSRWRDNPDFTNFMIRGVGEAPVIAFLFLISVFAVVIGPTNYFWLRRKRRLYLLPATVLIGAGSVTVALLVYALLADGFHVRARVRSVTAVDPRTGTSVSWSRQSYYAGLSPSEGMVFPRDTAVYPIVTDADRKYPAQTTRWDDQQRLVSGALPARATTQFLVIRSGASQCAVDVEPLAEGKPTRQAVNRLGTRIKYLVIRDEQGNFLEAEYIEPGSRVTLTASDAVKANSRFLAANPALFSQWYATGYYRRYYNNDMGLPNPQSLSSRMEQMFNACGTDLQKARHRTFAALVDDPVDVPLGVQGSTLDRDLHVVIGSWSEAKP